MSIDSELSRGKNRTGTNSRNEHLRQGKNNTSNSATNFCCFLLLSWMKKDQSVVCLLWSCRIIQWEGRQGKNDVTYNLSSSSVYTVQLYQQKKEAGIFRGWNRSSLSLLSLYLSLSLPSFFFGVSVFSFLGAILAWHPHIQRYLPSLFLDYKEWTRHETQESRVEGERDDSHASFSWTRQGQVTDQRRREHQGRSVTDQTQKTSIDFRAFLLFFVYSCTYGRKEHNTRKTFMPFPSASFDWTAI